MDLAALCSAPHTVLGVPRGAVDPVLVMLPDGSAKFVLEPHVTVADLLRQQHHRFRDHGHTLKLSVHGQPRRSLPDSLVLVPGETYCLLRDQSRSPVEESDSAEVASGQERRDSRRSLDEFDLGSGFAPRGSRTFPLLSQAAPRVPILVQSASADPGSLQRQLLRQHSGSERRPLGSTSTARAIEGSRPSTQSSAQVQQGFDSRPCSSCAMTRHQPGHSAGQHRGVMMRSRTVARPLALNWSACVEPVVGENSDTECMMEERESSPSEGNSSPSTRSSPGSKVKAQKLASFWKKLKLQSPLLKGKGRGKQSYPSA